MTDLYVRMMSIEMKVDSTTTHVLCSSKDYRQGGYIESTDLEGNEVIYIFVWVWIRYIRWTQFINIRHKKAVMEIICSFSSMVACNVLIVRLHGQIKNSIIYKKNYCTKKRYLLNFTGIYLQVNRNNVRLYQIANRSKGIN